MFVIYYFHFIANFVQVACSFYFTKLLRNPTQLDKLLLTISKMAEDTPKDRGNLFKNFNQYLDLENEESQTQIIPSMSLGGLMLTLI